MHSVLSRWLGYYLQFSPCGPVGSARILQIETSYAGIAEGHLISAQYVLGRGLEPKESSTVVKQLICCCLLERKTARSKACFEGLLGYSSVNTTSKKGE